MTTDGLLNRFVSNKESNDFEAYISNKSESIKDRLLASAVLKDLEPVGLVNRGIWQSKKKIFVLDSANCPSVILECGFISNEKDLAFIANQENQIKIANTILKAIQKYTNAQNRQQGN